MLARLSKLLLVAVLSCTLGLHWALLQSAAWVGMVVSYSQTAPLNEALAMTFDGKHPCNLCKFVRDGHRSEHKKETQKPVVQLDVLLDASRIVICPPLVEPAFRASLRIMDSRADSPPIPPPRSLQG